MITLCCPRPGAWLALFLHFIQLPVGEETYEISGNTLHATFDYTERGSHVPLTATLRMKPDLTPEFFEAKGKSYRPFSVDASVVVNGQTADRAAKAPSHRDLTVPKQFFTLSGYTPFPAMQMLMIRLLKASHGKPKRLAQFPAGTPGFRSDHRRVRPRRQAHALTRSATSCGAGNRSGSTNMAPLRPRRPMRAGCPSKPFASNIKNQLPKLQSAAGSPTAFTSSPLFRFTRSPKAPSRSQALASSTAMVVRPSPDSAVLVRDG